MPSVAYRELEHLPWPLVIDIMDLRAYARAKQAVDQAKAAGRDFDLPDGYWTDLAQTIEGEIWRRGLSPLIDRSERGPG